MAEAKLSERALKILAWLQNNPHPNPPPEGEGMPIRQQTLAEEFGCSRRTIGRAIKKLKGAGLLKETGRDKQSRCKTYALQAPSPLGGEGLGVRFSELDPGPLPQGEREPTPQGLAQLQSFPHLFECNLNDWPDWKNYYAAVTWEFKDTTCPHKLWRQTFDRLYVIRHQETGIPIPMIT